MTNNQPDTYRDLLEHERHLENRAFASLGNFLTANAFVFVAWVTLYKEGSDFRSSDWILLAIAIAGYLGSLAWSLIGARNWEYCRRTVGELIHIGGEYQSGKRENLYQVVRGLEETVHSTWNGRLKFGPMDLGRLGYHPTIIGGTPLMVALLYLVMLVVLLSERKLSAFGCAHWVLPTVVGTIGLIFLCLVFWACHESRKAADDAVEGAKEPKVQA